MLTTLLTRTPGPPGARFRSVPAAVAALVSGVVVAVLTGCGGGTAVDSDAYVERYSRACTTLSAIGAEYQQRLAAVATTTAFAGERKTVERVRGPITTMLAKTVRAYGPLRTADAPEQWQAFQRQLAGRLDSIVPSMTQMQRRVTVAQSKGDLAQATALVTRASGSRPLDVPASLVKRAPACRVLTERASA